MKTLLHICCAPCSVMCIESLRSEGIDPEGLWYNPNIHPCLEYKTRKNTLVDYAKQVDMKLHILGDYALREFICGVYPNFDERCEYCYTLRMDMAAKYTAENGFDSFTSTLLISPYQNHELLSDVMQKCGEKYGVGFLYRDFRPYFREGQNRAREMGLYMQKYCGCIFSEEDRYKKKKKRNKVEVL